MGHSAALSMQSLVHPENRSQSSLLTGFKDWRRLGHVHWRAPTVMGASFLAAIVLMSSHHALYEGFNGQPASSAALQSWLNRAGTALAFLSKLCLVIGAGTAYDQWLWVDLRSKTHQMAALDSMFAILNDAFEFLHPRLWCRRPVLTFLAASTWLLPIAAVFTPGTLSVQPVLQSSRASMQIPQRDYTSDNTLYAGFSTSGNTTSYGDISTGLFIPTMATLLANDVLPVPSSSTNLTYELPFYGPAISCNQSSDQDFQWAKKAMLDYENSTSSRVFYFGWVPQAGWGPDVNGTFFASTNLQIGNNRLDFVSQDAARVFVYLNTTGVDSSGSRAPLDEPAEAQMMTCALYNASYAARFEVNSTGSQRVTASTTFENWLPALTAVNGTSDDPLVARQMNLQAVMGIFGMMVIGPVVFSDDTSVSSSTSVYALELNQAIYPAREGLTQTEMTQRQMRLYEAFFQNITLSMRYGVVAGQVGEDQTPVEALSQEFQSQFVYESRTLFIAYGISILFASICILLGVHALLHNRASYTNSFSTIVRVTRDPLLSSLIADEGDLQGAEPVPEHIRKAEVRLGRCEKTSPGHVSSWI